MKINLSLKILSILLILSASVLSAQEAGSYPGEYDFFSFAVEQNGRPVPVRADRLELEKAPFTLILIMRGAMGVLVNFSEDDLLYKGFLKNKSLSEISDQPGRFMGMGEAAGNPDETVVIDSIVPHYMYYGDGATHRFSRTEERDGFVIAYRVISKFKTLAEGAVPFPVSEYEGDRLYLSFMRGEYDEDFNRIELQKEALQIRFKN